MKRKIVQINQDKCNGCELCVKACHEGAIEMINGKAVLVSDEYCDGLGDCLPACPTDAIQIIEREAADFDVEAVKKRMEERKAKEEQKPKVEKPMPCGCPGTMAKMINRDKKSSESKVVETKSNIKDITSELRQWPVQLKLINPNASYLDKADLLIAADCTAYAYGNFHQEFIKDRITIIACPKLDDNQYNIDKLTEIISNNDINSITVVKMSVPCCKGISIATKTAMLNAQKIVTYNEVTIGTDGTLLK